MDKRYEIRTLDTKYVVYDNMLGVIVKWCRYDHKHNAVKKAKELNDQEGYIIHTTVDRSTL